jgi:hypothetical protein
MMSAIADAVRWAEEILKEKSTQDSTLRNVIPWQKTERQC